MQKKAIVLVISLVTCANNAFPGSQLIQQDTLQHQKKNRFLDSAQEAAVQDEYTANQSDLEEYDEYISDNAQSPKISDLRAFFTELCGYMLVRYLFIRNALCEYGSELKDRINTWISTLIK